MKDYFDSPLAIGDIVVVQTKGYKGKVNETFRGRIIDAKEQKNGCKLSIERLDYFPHMCYPNGNDPICTKFDYTVIKYPTENVSDFKQRGAN